MTRTLHTLFWLFGLCGVIAAVVALPSIPTASAEPSTPMDTPTPVVSQGVDDWSIGSGLIYWGVDCFAVEFDRAGYLRRQPLAGGVQRTLETTDGEHCDMPFGMVALEDGVYYTDLSEKRIERTPPAEPYTGLPVATPVEADLPLNSALLRATADHIYWPVYFGGKILRAARADGALETVADGLTKPIEVLVVGNGVYWTESSGVWWISVGCDALPCNATKQQVATFPANTTGHSLYYRSNFRFETLYWVQRTTSGNTQSSSILFRTCGVFTLCQRPGTLYSAAANWELGGLISDGTNLFWNEGNAGVGGGNIKRKPLGAGDAQDIAVNQTYIDTRKLFIADGKLFFARLAGAGFQSGIYSLSLGASAITRDLAASALEVTQAIQNLANQAPLVAQKPTYVRAYGTLLAGPTAPTVEARLVGRRNGVALPGSPLLPVNGTRSLALGSSYDRARVNDGWLFLLPANWTAGNVTFELQVDPRRQQTDSNQENNVRSQTVTFQAQPPVCVWTVPVRTHTPLPKVGDPNFWAMVDHFTRRWPVPATWIYRDTEPVEELQVCWWGPIPHPCYGPYELEDGWALNNGIPDRDKVIVSLWTRAQLSFNPDACDDIGAPVHFMGMVHPNANNGGASGYASTVSNQSWVQLPAHTPDPVPPGWDALRAGSVMAQELAHNYGRKHVNCGGPDNVDLNYPYPPCQIANVGADSYYGFDVATRQPIRPNQTADFMSYANRSWVSDYTWRKLIDKFAAMRAAFAAPTGVTQDAAGDTVFASGLVDTSAGRGAIATVLVLPAATLPPATRQGQPAPVGGTPVGAHASDQPQANYFLQLLDPGGGVLATQQLTLLEMDDHVDDAHNALFSTVFAPPAGQVATVQLLVDATVMDTITTGINTPQVAIQQPAAGAQVDAQLVIQWTASDVDLADQLLFTIQYSHDGGASWHTLITDYPSAPGGAYTLTYADLGGLQGSAPNAARVRVLASDGYHTGIATSAGFTVKNRKPEPYIVAPGSGQSYPAGAVVVLQGGATDPEDGGLAGSALTWAVDGRSAGDGADVAAAGLAPGAHTAVLTATDTANNTARTSVQFAVTPLSIPLGATPLLDGKCEDSTYDAGAQVQLAPYAGSEQATVRLLRSDAYLWACFTGLQPGAATPGAFAGLRVDVNNSRNALAQSSDFGFFAGEDGDVFTLAGDGAGNFAAAGPGGLLAQIGVQATTWSAELRIDAAVLGGWEHLVGLSAGHYWRSFQGDDFVWPYTSVWNKPDTWATTALGSQPAIAVIDPYTATVGGPAFTLLIEGSGFVSGTTAYWGGTALPTTLADGEHLTVAVSAGRLGSAGQVQVTVRAPAPGNFTSNALPFLVEAPAPIITSLAPVSVTAGGPSFVIAVNGANFAQGAQVLWNGAPLTTQVVNGGQLTAQISSQLIADGQTAGIAVRNQTPAEQISATRAFLVNPLSSRLLLPLVRR